MTKRRSKKMAVTSLAETPVSPIDALVKKLDMVACEMETKWGMGCLPILCSPETAAKFMRGSDRLNVAIQSNDYDTVKAASENLIKGWQKMDEEATAIAPPLNQIWYVSSEATPGVEYIICRHELDAARIAAQWPHRASSVFTLADVARMIDNGSIGQKMDLLPRHAEVLKEAASNLGEILDDEIPW